MVQIWKCSNVNSVSSSSSHCLLTHVDLVRVERDAVAVQPVQVPRLGQQEESEQCSVMIRSRLESGFSFTAGRLSARILAEETHCCIVHRISPLLLLSPRLIWQQNRACVLRGKLVNFNFDFILLAKSYLPIKAVNKKCLVFMIYLLFLVLTATVNWLLLIIYVFPAPFWKLSFYSFLYYL